MKYYKPMLKYIVIVAVTFVACGHDDRFTSHCGTTRLPLASGECIADSRPYLPYNSPTPTPYNSPSPSPSPSTSPSPSPSSSPTCSPQPEDEGDMGDKEYVCHDGKTLHVSSKALMAHVKHGDSAGVCK